MKNVVLTGSSTHKIAFEMAKEQFIPLDGYRFLGENGFKYEPKEMEDILNFATSEGGRTIAVRFVKEITDFFDEVLQLDKKTLREIREGHMEAQRLIVLAESAVEIRDCVKFLQGLFDILDNDFTECSETMAA